MPDDFELNNDDFVPENMQEIWPDDEEPPF